MDIEYRHRKNSIVNIIYSNQKKQARERNMAVPTYTKKELRDWLYGQPLFHVLYDNYKRLDFQSKYKPSVDRKSNKLSYTMDNIQLMTWGENRAKDNEEKKIYKRKAVCQYTKAGIFVAEYISIKEATSITKIHQISRCCLGERRTAGGYTWKFKKEQ